MPKNLKWVPTWTDEIEEKGLKKTLEDRLKFHGGMNLALVVGFAGCAQSTAKKHLNKLVESGKATVEFLHGDWHYRYTSTI